MRHAFIFVGSSVLIGLGAVSGCGQSASPTPPPGGGAAVPVAAPETSTAFLVPASSQTAKLTGFPVAFWAFQQLPGGASTVTALASKNEQDVLFSATFHHADSEWVADFEPSREQVRLSSQSGQMEVLRGPQHGASLLGAMGALEPDVNQWKATHAVPYDACSDAQAAALIATAAAAAACFTAVTPPQWAVCAIALAAMAAANQRVTTACATCAQYPSCNSVCPQGVQYQAPYPDCTCVCLCSADCQPGDCGYVPNPCGGSDLYCGACGGGGGGGGGDDEGDDEDYDDSVPVHGPTATPVPRALGPAHIQK